MPRRSTSSWSRAWFNQVLAALAVYFSAAGFPHAVAGAALELPARPAGPIYDGAGVIEDSAEAALDAELRAYYQQTGNAVVVATVPTLQGEAASVYATALFSAWGIGDAAKDTGALLLVSPFGAEGERDVWIEVGYGLEGDLPDAEVSWIVRDTLLPAYRAGDVSGGTVAGAREIVKAIGDVSYAPAASSTAFDRELAEVLLWAAFAVVAIFAGTKRKWDGPLVGSGLAALLGWVLIGGALAVIAGVFLGAVAGFLLELWMRKAGHGSSRGGFWGGGSSWGGGGFGGFGGGSSGGGGGGGRW